MKRINLTKQCVGAEVSSGVRVSKGWPFQEPPVLHAKEVLELAKRLRI